MQVKKQQLEPNMEQQTGLKLGKEYKASYCHPAYLTSMQSTIMRNAGLEEAQAGIKIARRNINNLRYAGSPGCDESNLVRLRVFLFWGVGCLA